MPNSTLDLAMSTGGSAEAYLTRPDDEPHPGVLFFIDAIGLRPATRAMADRIASWGYVVMAPHVFHREGTAAETAPEGDLLAPGAREDFFKGAMKRVNALTTDLALPDIDDYVAALVAQPGVTTPIGTTGYCMGARLAVRTATRHPDLVAACGGFHGGGLATDADDSPHLDLPDARAEFLFGHADNDRSMPPEAVARLGDTLAAAGLTATNEVRRGAAHGYTMPDTSVYDADATEWHFRELRALFDRTLPQP